MRNLIACLLLFVSAPAFAQCAALLPGTAPLSYRITFSNGRVVRVDQQQPTPQGGNPCMWTSLQSDGAFMVLHTQMVTGAPAGGFMSVPAVYVGIPSGMNTMWKGTIAADPRDGAGPWTIPIGGGLTATVAP
jgi:hypothetical protein